MHIVQCLVVKVFLSQDLDFPNHHCIGMRRKSLPMTRSMQNWGHPRGKSDDWGSWKKNLHLPFFYHYPEYMGGLGIKYYSSDLSRGCLSIALHCSMSLVMRKSIWIWYCAIDTCTHVYNYTCISMWLCTCKVNMFVCIPVLLRALDTSKRARGVMWKRMLLCIQDIWSPDRPDRQ